MNREIQNTYFPKKLTTHERKSNQAKKSAERRLDYTYKHIKDDKDIGKYHSVNYFYMKSAGKCLTVHEKELVLNALTNLATNMRKRDKYISQAEIAKEEIADQKLYLKSKVATIYSDLNLCQDSLNQERNKITKRQLELDQEQRDAKNLLDTNNGVNRLIKRSIVETYNLVKNNSRATSIKLQVCSASKYLKKTNRI